MSFVMDDYSVTAAGYSATARAAAASDPLSLDGERLTNQAAVILKRELR